MFAKFIRYSLVLLHINHRYEHTCGKPSFFIYFLKIVTRVANDTDTITLMDTLSQQAIGTRFT